MSEPSQLNLQRTTTCTIFGPICTRSTSFVRVNVAFLLLPFVLPVPHIRTRSKSSLPLSCYRMESMMGYSSVSMWFCSICTIWHKYPSSWTHSLTIIQRVVVVWMEAAWWLISSCQSIVIKVIWTFVIVLLTIVLIATHNQVITFNIHSRHCFVKDWMLR